MTISIQLQQLCQLHGINICYRDMNGATKEASTEALLAVLRALDPNLISAEDITAAHRIKHLKDWQIVCPPVIVVWEGSNPSIKLHLPSYLLGASIPLSITLESGEVQEFLWKLEPASVLEQKTVEGSVYLVASFNFARFLPFGYHRLKIELPWKTQESIIVSAPIHAYTSPFKGSRKWGVFLPLYALQGLNDWGTGNFTDLKRLIQWTSGLGGEVVGTLPLLSGFFDSRFGPGPYLPASKMFWNEFYLDICCIPEFTSSVETQNIYKSVQFQNELSFLRKSGSVLYERELKLKRQILEILSKEFWAQKPPHFADFEIFLANHPAVLEYARFRAAGEEYGLDWHLWPRPLPDCDSINQNRLNYHAYVQWLASRQINDLNAHSTAALSPLYMDLPVGVHPFSYDIWKERESFAEGIDCGAPPDPVFTSGQNWNFPPMHPQHIRDQGYRYFIQSLRHQLKSCGMLRIDHMMNFHRLFWIPKGMPNSDGVYVNYMAEEFYAILVLESVNHKTTIIGEDLGLVPEEVRPMMEKHAIHRMFVGQFELISDNKMGHIPSDSVASLNTHDMFPFAAFWEEADIIQRQKISLIDDSTAKAELTQRRETKRALISILQYKGLDNDFDHDTAAALKAILRLLADSPSETVLVNLEDLWLEQKPQNIPGTFRPQNWSHKAKYSFDQFTKLPVVVQLLQEIDAARKGTS